ncbi:vesicular glutamate transporter 1 [Contarinia nasturtii]|uniref:vesicular glutamate transporter 1 n=1 Tax=Contarinia nasturtii TaxID=265458 RepID=UPI0012D4027B|nr:vesicular glutamate transporter 1 [Contarinia nasturtii]XP_031633347.1 vesicular glutamate transporter 1 [Contarinia nasturtii]XP_031633348.1 vesicular glutamate transporter 1 [Contarinia nasturtii]XP_031633349.1 vesicular glutamate transporter 1 [Contarinia nasturtii]XP_031633350.1 vesicular glutamate transporter 1 [Contarinia nasturtii]XP_031633351.1 vesicular glutamate transporter 1 [Contarinia nasturtii]XP_031633352.1 vesicular glutamate transporter 1 [Contarinia nasturtii]XP_03163335
MPTDPKIDRESGAQNNNIGAIKPEIEPLSWKFWQKRRYIVVLMAFLGFFNVYSLRVNLSVGIVAMTEYRTVYYPNGTVGYEQEFAWDSKDRGLILSSFFWGYILTQFIGGLLGSKIGGNLVFGIGIAVTSILTLLTPLAAKAGVGSLVAVRLIEGIFEGVTFPCIHAVWSRWAPPLERSRMATIAFAGNYAGTIVSMPVSGILANEFGWESCFYVFGAIGCVWYVLWIIIVRESPDKDKYISKDELRYIQDSLGSNTKASIKHPWKDIFTSKAVYAISASHFAENWGFYTMLTQLPSFLKDTLGYKLEKAGFLAGAPYLAMGILLAIAGYLADICQVKGYLTTTQVRRYFNCGGFLAQTVFLMTAAYLMSPTGTIACIIIAIGLGAFSWCGFAVNHLDIAPQHASVLMGISNTFGTIPGIVSPTLTGFIVLNSSAEEWQIVFMISAGVYLFGCVIYWMWATGEVQPWAQKTSSSESKPKPADTATYVGYANEGLEMSE